MADQGFKDYVIKFLLAGVFLLAMFTFAVNFTTGQGKSADVIDDGNLNLDRLETQINSTTEEANAWAESFRSDNIFVATGTIVLFSIWGVGKLIWNSIISLFTLLIDGASTVLGVPPMVIGVITAILLISLIFALWRVMKRGD